MSRRKLNISIGSNRKSTHWQQTAMTWDEFCKRLDAPVRSSETMAEYLRLPKSRQDELKDVGGFVGGALKDGRRKAANVESRDLITLDLDNISAGGTSDVLDAVEGLGCAAAVYSTRKHTDRRPRLRVIIPLSEAITPEEYEPVARMIADCIGISWCDPTTFEAVRLMYWGSCCSDGVWVFKCFKGDFCVGRKVLTQMYENWKDFSQWPCVPGEETKLPKLAAKQTDPTTKDGIVGQFCRTYGISQAIETFLPGIYASTDIDGRYTYLGGSTAGGAVIYDQDRFLYSHHATDPCSGLLVNSFDMVRLHKFADLDADKPDGTAPGQLPSFKAMADFAMRDPNVIALAQAERMALVEEAFGPALSDDDPDWETGLRRKGNSFEIQPTINNYKMILEHHPALKGRIRQDVFSGCMRIICPVPWDNRSRAVRRYTDADAAGLYHFVESCYGTLSRPAVDDAVIRVGREHRVNEVADYLDKLTWDGVKRIDTLLSDYLGAADSDYNSAVIRKALCAAVARATADEDGDGVKFDFMPIIAGPQGIGKSTLLSRLGGRWFSDSLTVFAGKEAAELIQGTWINEVGELTAFTKSETEEIKQFLSKKSDIYRAAYGRNTENHVRRCVFIGTSNQAEFLRDQTGNRRFWPVDVGIQDRRLDPWMLSCETVDQIWAEATALYKNGELLYMEDDLKTAADEAQEKHKEVGRWEGRIKSYLDEMIPENWDSMSTSQKRMFRNGGIRDENIRLVNRKRVCAAEIWDVCFEGDLKFMKQTDAREINAVIRKSAGWKSLIFKDKFYGTQRGFER